MNAQNLIFCAASLAVTITVSALAYPYAAVSQETLDQYRTPVDAESLGEINLGDFGSVSVVELMTYYLENPPAAGSGVREVRFQGC